MSDLPTSSTFAHHDHDSQVLTNEGFRERAESRPKVWQTSLSQFVLKMALSDSAQNRVSRI